VALPPRNPELEAAIVSDPDSPDAFLVYGDWLLEMEEPLGELVSVQAALAKITTDEEQASVLRQREVALLAENEKKWIGHFKRYEHTWSFGFLESIKLDEPDRGDCIDVLELVAARFLRELEIELLGHRAFENGEVVSALAEVGLPPILRKLTLQPRSANARAVDIGSMRALWPRLARLKELTVRAGNITFGAIDLPMVEKVTFTTNPTAEALNAFARASWPKLTDLTIEFTEQDQAYRQGQPFDAALFEPFLVALGSRRPDKDDVVQQVPLQRFAFTGHFSGDALVELLGTTDLLASPALTSLDLSRTGITDVGAQTILNALQRWKRLTKLDLRENFMTAAFVDTLKKELGEDRVDVSEQRPNYYGNYDGYEEPDDEADDDDDAE